MYIVLYLSVCVFFNLLFSVSPEKVFLRNSVVKNKNKSKNKSINHVGNGSDENGEKDNEKDIEADRTPILWVCFTNRPATMMTHRRRKIRRMASR